MLNKCFGNDSVIVIEKQVLALKYVDIGGDGSNLVNVVIGTILSCYDDGALLSALYTRDGESGHYDA